MKSIGSISRLIVEQKKNEFITGINLTRTIVLGRPSIHVTTNNKQEQEQQQQQQQSYQYRSIPRISIGSTEDGFRYTGILSSSSSCRFFSSTCSNRNVATHTAAAVTTATTNTTTTTNNSLPTNDGPYGELFSGGPRRVVLGKELLGRTGSIRRTFGPRDNTDAILATGGEALAAHASFDPNYARAQGWIRQHAVGPAVLSPILVQGLIGALSEAAFPEGVLIQQSTQQIQPLIVGVTVRATIEVTNVEHSTRCLSIGSDEKKNGYTIALKSSIVRIRDDEPIVHGSIVLWIPDYENM